EQVGVGGEMKAGARRPPARAGYPPEPLAEDDLREEAEEEHRRRVDDDPEEASYDVDRSVSVPAADEADRDTDDNRDEKRCDRELERRCAVLGDNLLPG